MYKIKQKEEIRIILHKITKRAYFTKNLQNKSAKSIAKQGKV